MPYNTNTSMKAAEQRNTAQLDTQAPSFRFCSTVRKEDVNLTLILSITSLLEVILGLVVVVL
jgi:hypothetical protein